MNAKKAKLFKSLMKMEAEIYGTFLKDVKYKENKRPGESSFDVWEIDKLTLHYADQVIKIAEVIHVSFYVTFGERIMIHVF